MPAKIQHTEEIGAYCVNRCAAFLSGLKDASVLKTDAWNEIRKDIPGTVPFVGNIHGVTDWTLVEIMPDRAETARKMLPGVTVLTTDLSAVKFGEATFDAIICPATLNFMLQEKGWRALEHLFDWLKPGGRLYLTAWVAGLSRDAEDQHGPNERRIFKAEDIETHLMQLFGGVQRDFIFNTVVLMEQTWLIGYECVKP